LGPEVAFGKIADWGVVGAWVTHLTDVLGDSLVSTNVTSAKIFFAYGLGNGWQIISNPEISYDWEAVSGERAVSANRRGRFKNHQDWPQAVKTGLRDSALCSKCRPIRPEVAAHLQHHAGLRKSVFEIALWLRQWVR
jgi:hypothetical protein